MLFNPLVEKRARHLDNQCAAIKLQRHYGHKPRVKGLLVFRPKRVFDDLKAVCPYSLVIFFYHFAITILYYQLITHKVPLVISLAKFNLFLCIKIKKKIWHFLLIFVKHPRLFRYPPISTFA